MQELRSAKTDTPASERLFESYMASQGLAFEYEPQFGRHHPDYLVHCSGGDCVLEVEELRDPDPPPTGGFSSVPAIRGAMRRARNQLRECKHLPTGIVLYSEAFLRNVEPLTVMAAAFGPGFQNARSYERVEPFSDALRFAKRSELSASLQWLANPFLSSAANRSVSAIIVLRHYCLSEFQLAVYRQLLARQDAGETLRPGASMAVAAELQHTVPQTYRFEGTLRVVVIDNPHARIPFPSELFRGPFDQRWAWQDEWALPVWIGSTAAELYTEGVPFHLL